MPKFLIYNHAFAYRTTKKCQFFLGVLQLRGNTVSFYWFSHILYSFMYRKNSWFSYPSSPKIYFFKGTEIHYWKPKIKKFGIFTEKNILKSCFSLPSTRQKYVTDNPKIKKFPILPKIRNTNFKSFYGNLFCITPYF
jgi:hypothetical protein